MGKLRNGSGRAGRDGEGDLSRDGGAQGRVGSWLCPHWVGVLQGPRGVQLVAPWCRERILPHQEQWLCWLRRLSWLKATLTATGLATPMTTNQCPAGQKQQSLHTLGERGQGSSLPPASLAMGIRVWKEHLAMSPAPLQALAWGGESQQCHRVRNAQSGWGHWDHCCQPCSGPAPGTALPLPPSSGGLSPPLPVPAAAGHGDIPQAPSRPAGQRVTVSLGRTRRWNKLKASRERLDSFSSAARSPGPAPLLARAQCDSACASTCPARSAQRAGTAHTDPAAPPGCSRGWHCRALRVLPSPLPQLCCQSGHRTP